MATPGPQATRSRELLPAAVLFLAIAVAYLPSLRNGWIWDDDDYVTRNAVIQRGADGLAEMWTHPTSLPQWYPVVHTTFWIEHKLWGLHPAGYHLVNALLHALGAVLLWRLLRRLDLPGAWIAGLLFGLHPVQVESVAWVTERKNCLSGVLYLLSMGAALRWLGVGRTEPGEPGRRGLYALALGLFLLALLSKTVTATLPAAVLVIVWWKRGRLGRREVLPLLPFFILGAGLGLFTVWLEREHVGAAGADWSLGPAQRWLLAGRAAWFYLGSLLWPADLAFIYPRWALDPSRAAAWLYPAAAAGVPVWLWFRRREWGRGPLAAALLFLGTLFPALGFFSVYPFRYSFVADHFQYLAAAAPLAAAATLLRRVADAGPAGRAATGVLLAALGGLTWAQQGMYADAETLWRETARRTPSAAIAWTNLGALEQRRGNRDEAERLTRRALDLAPRNYEAWNNLGNALRARGAREEAVACYGRALEIMPAFSMARTNLGKALREGGDTEGALACWRRVLEENPDHLAAHAALVETLRDEGRREEAVEACRQAVARWPGEAALRVELGRLLADGPRPAEGVAVLEEALRLAPGSLEARRALGRALHAAGEGAGAAAVLEQAVRTFPRSAEAHDDLGVVLRSLGRTGEAEARFREALALDPPAPDGWLHLADLLAEDGRPAAAERALREALRVAEEAGDAARAAAARERLGAGR